MKKASIFTAILFLVSFATFTACRKESAESAQDMNTDTSSTATSTDTTGTMSASSATTTASTGGTVSAMSTADKEFVMKAAIGGMAEVQMGQLAAQKASDPAVKAFGQRMVDDHSKANDELKQLATVKGLTIPTELDGKHKKMADDLGKLSGSAFDKKYMKEMVDDHKEDVAEFQKQSTAAQDADLKGWAAKTLPTLQDHLKQAEATARKVKA